MSCSCDEARFCDECFERAKAEYSYLRHVPRHQVCGDQQAQDERDQELRDAGRGHLVSGISDAAWERHRTIATAFRRWGIEEGMLPKPSERLP